MSILDRILPTRRDAEVTQWASQLVERQHHYVWARLSARAGSLASLAEARGYIRSRALSELRDGLRAMVSSLPLATELHDQVLRRAQDLLVNRFALAMVRPAPARVPARCAA